MLFQKINKEGDWIIVDYSATWKYDYDFMLDAAQTLIDTDFKEHLQRVAISQVAGSPDMEKIEEVRAHQNDLRKCDSLKKEIGTLSVAGISTTMECPVQIVFYNQTKAVRLFCPMRQYFEEYGDHIFDNFMNSLEIRAYCKDTERQTRKRLSEINKA